MRHEPRSIPVAVPVYVCYGCRATWSPSAAEIRSIGVEDGALRVGDHDGPPDWYAIVASKGDRRYLCRLCERQIEDFRMPR